MTTQSSADCHPAREAPSTGITLSETNTKYSRVSSRPRNETFITAKRINECYELTS